MRSTKAKRASAPKAAFPTPLALPLPLLVAPDGGDLTLAMFEEVFSFQRIQDLILDGQARPAQFFGHDLCVLFSHPQPPGGWHDHDRQASRRLVRHVQVPRHQSDIASFRRGPMQVAIAAPGPSDRRHGVTNPSFREPQLDRFGEGDRQPLVNEDNQCSDAIACRPGVRWLGRP